MKKLLLLALTVPFTLQAENVSFKTASPFLAPQLHDFISNTTMVEIPEKSLKADISFLFIDFKYDSNTNKIKICEFGRGKTTGLGNTPVTMSIGGAPTTIFSPYWPSLWQYLAETINMPVWYVGIKPADHLDGKLNISESNDAWYRFLNIGGKYHFGLTDLENDPEFKQAKNGSFNYSQLNSHKGLIIYKPQASDKRHFAAFQKNHPQFLYLDDVGSIYGAYKHIGASLFDDPSLKAYKPCFKSYPKKYSSTLAATIINDIKSDMFVIKPVSAGYGRGIMMVTKEDLDVTLRYICGQNSNIKIPSDSYEKQSHTFSHWKHNKDQVFIVEEYCPSTPLFVHNKVYDPTVRVHFVLRHDAGKIFVNMLGGYHKIPVKALSDEGSLTEKHKTVPYYKSDVALSALTIPDDEFIKITNELRVALPKIYHKMLKNYGVKKS